MDRLSAMEAYVRLVELGTFSAVASELRVKQSTVSKWISRTESELGVQLLERTTRRMRVTDAGQLYYERAREILGAYASALAALQDDAMALKGRLRISVPVVFGRLFVVPPLLEFLKLHQELEVELSFGDRYVNLVDEGYDLSIRVGLAVDSSQRARKLGQTPRVLVASPEYLERCGEPETPAALEGHQCLLHTGLRKGATWLFRKDEGLHRASVQGRISANHSETLRAMACEGLGIALLASWLVEDELREGRLLPLLTGYGLPPAPISAVLPPGRHVHPRVRRFLEHMQAAFARRFGS